MITIYPYNDFNKYDEECSKALFKDPLFKLIGYIDNENFIIFHTDSYLYRQFLKYDDYSYYLRNAVGNRGCFRRINYYKGCPEVLKIKSILISDIFKNKIDIDRISFDISNAPLKISVKKIIAEPGLYININSSIPLNPKFIQNLKIERDRLFKLEDKIERLSYDKKRMLHLFYLQKGICFITKLNIKTNNKEFKNNITFLDLFDNHYNFNNKFDNNNVTKLIEAIYRNIPKDHPTFRRKSEINIQHNGINLEIFKYHSWHGNHDLPDGYRFTNFNCEINPDSAINFLKMTPNFETFLYQLEKNHLSQV